MQNGGYAKSLVDEEFDLFHLCTTTVITSFDHIPASVLRDTPTAMVTLGN